jgi:hypothetical protein
MIFDSRAFVPVLNTIAIAMFVFFTFGIMAVQLLGGQMSYCTDLFVATKAECVGVNPFTNQTRVWSHRKVKYDWIGDFQCKLIIMCAKISERATKVTCPSRS